VIAERRVRFTRPVEILNVHGLSSLPHRTCPVFLREPVLLDQIHCPELVENPHCRGGKQRFADSDAVETVPFRRGPPSSRSARGSQPRTNPRTTAYHHRIVFSLRRGSSFAALPWSNLVAL